LRPYSAAAQAIVGAFEIGAGVFGMAETGGLGTFFGAGALFLHGVDQVQAGERALFGQDAQSLVQYILTPALEPVFGPSAPFAAGVADALIPLGLGFPTSLGPEFTGEAGTLGSGVRGLTTEAIEAAAGARSELSESTQLAEVKSIVAPGARLSADYLEIPGLEFPAGSTEWTATRPELAQKTLFPLEANTGAMAPDLLGSTPPREIPFGIDIGEVKSINWSVDKTFDYLGNYVFTEGLDLRGGTQAAVRYADHPTLYVDLRQLGGMEQSLGQTYQLALDPAEFQKATAGLKFGSSAYGNSLESLARERLSVATGTSFAVKSASAGGADILPLQLRLRFTGVDY
jgi:hypothetical protein